MSKSKKGLGRGFESLIPTDLLDEAFDPTAAQDEKVSQLQELPIGKISPDLTQPRKHFDEEALEELAQSIRIHGILQPIIVVPKGDGYQLVAGERRYRAAQKAGLATIPSLVRTLDDQNRLELSLIENIQRRDLNAIEMATAYQKLRDQFNLTLGEIGKRVGNKSFSSISNTMRLLKLPKFVQESIAKGELTEGQARPLVGHDMDLIRSIIPRIIAEDWSARKVEQFIVNMRSTDKTDEKPSNKVLESQHEAHIELLKKRLATPVTIRVNGKGSGQIVIKFKDKDDLERLQKLLSD